MNRPLGFFLLFVLAAAIGCQGSDNQLTYANVKGTVNYNGHPLEKGQITFSVAGQPPTVIDITDGKYAGQAVVGSNKIMISAKKKGPAPAAPGGLAGKDMETQRKGYQEKLSRENGQTEFADPSMVEYIPAEWNTASTQMRVVESGAANDFQFDIKGK